MRKALILILLISFSVTAEEPIKYEIERSEVVTIKSNTLNRTYELFIKLPRSYKNDSKKKYPVLFLTDANYSFPLVSSIVRQMSGFGKIKEVIIVGMSYAKGEWPGLSRTRDYTPTNSPNEKIGHSKEAKEASGGAKQYLNFINSEIIPYIDDHYRADMSNKIYAGHSFGGLFGGYVAKVAPETFDSYILSDPSFWYGNEAIFNFGNKLEKKIRANILIVSSNPEKPPKRDSFPHNMVINAKRFERQLIDRFEKGSFIKAKIYNGQLHETIFPMAISQGLLQFVAK